MKKERVAIIGSGIVGTTTALLLSNAGYEISIFEESRQLFRGTSRIPRQVHLGGLYSSSLPTAKECLDSAINFKRKLPFAMSKTQTLFLVSERSDISYSDFVKFYQTLTDYYSSLEKSKQVFGSANCFYRTLNSYEFDFCKGIEGGIQSHEPSFNMNVYRTLLLNELRQRKVGTHLNTHVENVEPNGDIFTIETTGQSGYQKFETDQVVNTGGYKARLLDHRLGDRTFYNLQLKAMNLLEVPKDSINLPHLFVVRGNFLHHAPINDRLVSMILSDNDNCYIDSLQFGQSEPSLPSEWIDIMSKGEVPDAHIRQARTLEKLRDEYFPTLQANAFAFIPGITVGYSSDIGSKLQQEARQITPGYITAVPTKASHALTLAEQVLSMILSNSIQKQLYKHTLAEYPEFTRGEGISSYKERKVA